MASTTRNSRSDEAGGPAAGRPSAPPPAGGPAGAPPAADAPVPPGPRAAGGPRRRTKRTYVLWAISGAIAILVVWELLALFVNPIFIASPAGTAKALAGLAWGSTLWIELLITLKRLVIGLAVGSAFGLVLGVLGGLDERLHAFFEPIRWVGMTMPAVIIVGLAMFWFGLGDFTVTFTVGLLVIPTVYINTSSGILSVDKRLVEMGRVYHFPRRLLLFEIYAPGIASPVMAGLTLATGTAVRAVVLAEVLGAQSGIGHAFSRASSELETADLFAWIVVLLALMALLEFAVLRPLKRRVMRWRKATP